MNRKKIALFGSAIVLAAVSALSIAADTFQYPWYGTPYAYTSVRDCTWNYTGSYGGSWGSQFNYVASGYCAFGTKMQVNRSGTNNYVTIVIQ